MPKPDGYALLPAQDRAWFDQALKQRGYGDYENLTRELGERLRARGIEPPSMATVGRWGLARKKAMESTVRVAELLSSIHDAAPDDAAKRTAGLSTLIQDRIVNLLFALEETRAEAAAAAELGDAAEAYGAQFEEGKLLAKLGSTISQMQRAEIAQRQWQSKVEDDTRKRTAEELAAKVDADGGSVTPARLREIMRDTYGV
jgi:hypothetical protein